MKHYEERLEQDLNQIRQQIGHVASQVEKAIQNSVEALLQGNRELAYATILGDNPINRTFEEINQLCYGFVARHLPSAGHLRRISSILRFNIELERVGDHAVTICREAVQFSKPLETSFIHSIERLSEDARHILHQANTAFIEDNAEKANNTTELAKRNNQDFENALNDLLKEGETGSWPLKDLFAIMAIYAVLSRVSDLAKNICEETIFVVTGKTKKRKPVEILFLDQTHHQSLMAEFIARKAFPNSGHYTSAGYKPKEPLHPRFSEFMDRCGFDVNNKPPTALTSLPKFDDFHIIISLEKPVTSYIPQIPFHTIALEWELENGTSSTEENEMEKSFEKLHQELSFQIQQLMEILRGKEAS